MADGFLNFDTKISTSGFNAGVKKLGSIAKGGLAVLGTAVAGSVASFGLLTKSALNSVASLEQNIGGVETLFKDSAQTVIDSANRAYKTAGMSANEYMSTVTSFSASLLQSLKGDTENAASYADRAIIDMSDNANKMGTSMGLIQNAYQGFAKQNYTMLDNLKLGYGGTKEEMQRLISDASKMTDVQQELGITVDESSLSFGNIVNAISVMQKSMGIAGTTAAEAATTIEGSVNSVKAAWDNLLNGTISPEDFADTFAIAAENIGKNLAEIIPRLASTIPAVGRELYRMLSDSLSENGSELIQSGVNVINNYLSGIKQSAPRMLSTVASIGKTLLSGLKDVAPQMLSAGSEIVTSLVNAIMTYAPSVLQAGYDILDKLATGFSQGFPGVLSKFLDLVQGIGDRLAAAAPGMVQKGFELLSKLAEGIVNAIPVVIEKVPQIITTFANIINDNFPTILAKGFELLKQLALGIVQAIPVLIANIPQIIEAIIAAFTAYNWAALGSNIINVLSGGIKAMAGAASSAGKSIFDSIKTAISNLPQTLLNIGKNAISKLGSGITGMRGLVSAAGNAIFNAIKSAIMSLPSALASIGRNAISSMTSAFSGGIGGIIGKARSIVSGIKGAFSGQSWSSIGSNIVSGIANGLSAAAGRIASAAMNAAKSALNFVKNFLGIKSPSRRFRDEVGKMMALGMGIGFEQNVPVGEIENSIDETIKRANSRVQKVTSKGQNTTDRIVRSVTNNYTDSGIDYRKLKKVQKEAMNEANERPVVLNGREVNRALA